MNFISITKNKLYIYMTIYLFLFVIFKAIYAINYK